MSEGWASDIDAMAAAFFADLAAARGDRAERLSVLGRARVQDWLTELLDAPERDEEAWSAIVRLIEVAPNQQGLFDVAAGPLEDALQFHTDRFGERILGKAIADPRFRLALNGVWGWERVAEPLRTKLTTLLR